MCEILVLGQLLLCLEASIATRLGTRVRKVASVRRFVHAQLLRLQSAQSCERGEFLLLKLPCQTTACSRGTGTRKLHPLLDLCAASRDG